MFTISPFAYHTFTHETLRCSKLLWLLIWYQLSSHTPWAYKPSNKVCVKVHFEKFLIGTFVFVCSRAHQLIIQKQKLLTILSAWYAEREKIHIKTFNIDLFTSRSSYTKVLERTFAIYFWPGAESEKIRFFLIIRPHFINY